MSDRPGAEKFHDDHKQMCEICRGLDEALVEAHAHLSDRVAELAEVVPRFPALRGCWSGSTYLPVFAGRLQIELDAVNAENQRLEAEVERLRAALKQIANPPQDKPGPLRQVLSSPYEDARDVARAALAKEEA